MVGVLISVLSETRFGRFSRKYFDHCVSGVGNLRIRSALRFPVSAVNGGVFCGDVFVTLFPSSKAMRRGRERVSGLLRWHNSDTMSMTDCRYGQCYVRDSYIYALGVCTGFFIFLRQWAAGATWNKMGRGCCLCGHFGVRVG